MFHLSMLTGTFSPTKMNCTSSVASWRCLKSHVRRLWWFTEFVAWICESVGKSQEPIRDCVYNHPDDVTSYLTRTSECRRLLLVYTRWSSRPGLQSRLPLVRPGSMLCYDCNQSFSCSFTCLLEVLDQSDLWPLTPTNIFFLHTSVRFSGLMVVVKIPVGLWCDWPMKAIGVVVGVCLVKMMRESKMTLKSDAWVCAFSTILK